ncbi:hypothetical protein LPJ58_005590, partial [Coemansia sp. RSA 1591]
VKKARYLVLQDAGHCIDRVVEVKRRAEETLDEVVDKVNETAIAIDSWALKKTANAEQQLVDQLLHTVNGRGKAKLVQQRSEGRDLARGDTARVNIAIAAVTTIAAV